MNTATRLFNARIIHEPQVERYSQVWNFGIKILLVLLIISAFAVVYLRDLNRRMFIEYQELQQQTQEAELQWEKLLLEKSNLTVQTHIQKIAETNLQMAIPSLKDTIVLSD